MKTLARTTLDANPKVLAIPAAARIDLLVKAAEPTFQNKESSGGESVPQLSGRGIILAGVSNAPPVPKLMGCDPSAVIWMVCFNQPAMVSVAGTWRPYDAGTACLLKNPAAINLDPGDSQTWGYAFVCYEAKPGSAFSGRLREAECERWCADGLVHAIGGLHSEAASAASPALLHHWVELIHGYLVSFAGSPKLDQRVDRAWNIISGNLKHDWSVDEMASAAMMSSEHFRRLCLKELGCSPMRHLTRIRMERAAELLSKSSLKIDAICDEVGYEYRSTFSNVFTKVFGVRPSTYRDNGFS